MKQIEILGTQSCRLCDEAKQIIYSTLEHGRYELTEIDILLDDKLFDEFRYSIPVVRLKDQGAILPWPFDNQSLLQFVEATE